MVENRGNKHLIVFRIEHVILYSQPNKPLTFSQVTGFENISRYPFYLDIAFIIRFIKILLEQVLFSTILLFRVLNYFYYIFCVFFNAVLCTEYYPIFFFLINSIPDKITFQQILSIN